MNRLPALTGLRGVAAVTIVAFHASGGVAGTIPGGFLGVDIFFVLSGFLITSLLLEERKRCGRLDYLAFYIRRALRLLPALFLVCIFAELAATVASTPGQLEVTRGQLIPSLFYFANWHEVARWDAGGNYRGLLDGNWSLSIEEQFYVIWPITLAFLSQFNRRRLAIALMVGVLLEVGWGTWLASHGAGIHRVEFGSDTRSGGLLVGASIALAHFDGWRVRPTKLTVYLATLLLLLMLWQAPFPLPIQLLVVWGCAGVLVAWVATGGAGPLAWSDVVFCGTISYGIYLWQQPLIAIASDSPILKGFSDVSAPIAALLSVFVAAASYQYWERPFLAMQARWRRSVLVPSGTEGKK